MHLIDSPNAVNNQFVPGNPVTGLAPTYYTASWSNAIQNELANAISADGHGLDRSDDHQLRRLLFVTTATQAAGLLLTMTNQLRCCKPCQPN